MSTAGAEGRVVTSRIVLFGPAGAGATTMLETIARRLRADQRGALVRQGSPTEGSGAYEILPLELREVNGLNPRFQLATVPGGPAHAPTRRQLLKGADGILFVADSVPDRAADAVAAMQELAEHLAACGRPLDTLPIVILLNKRDRPDAVPAEQLLRPLLQRLGGRRPPVFEAVATDGRGVLNALSAIAKLVLARLGHPTGAEVRRAGPQPAPGTGTLGVRRGSLGAPPDNPAPSAPEPLESRGRLRPPPDNHPRGATGGAGVTVGTPRAAPDGLVVPLLVRDAHGVETRLTLTLRIEPLRGDAAGDGGRGARS